MMSDHWKSLTRLLGATGAADPPESEQDQPACPPEQGGEAQLESMPSRRSENPPPVAADENTETSWGTQNSESEEKESSFQESSRRGGRRRGKRVGQRQRLDATSDLKETNEKKDPLGAVESGQPEGKSRNVRSGGRSDLAEDSPDKEGDRPRKRRGSRGRGGRAREKVSQVEETREKDELPFGAPLVKDSEEGFADGEGVESKDTADRQDSEEPARRRRRRRRRGSGSGGRDRKEESGAFGESLVETSQERKGQGKVDGRTVDATFDDDHEDADEIVELRRGQQRGRRSGFGQPLDDTDPESASETPADQATSGRGRQRGGTQKRNPKDSERTKQRYREVMTWVDTVDILISNNMEKNRREVSRGRGGRSGRSGRSGSQRKD